METAHWYWKNLGDALLASPVLQQIKKTVLEGYPDASQNPDITVFWRQTSDNGLHCNVNVYFSPKLVKIANKFDANVCEKPILAGLECLVGYCDIQH